MKMVIFGLTISSSWGNGHATLWRGLIGALARRGWRVVFFERDAPYYRQTRDLHEIAGGELVLYDDWTDAAARAERELRDADVGVVSSYCPDAIEAGDLLAASTAGLRVFYDLDTPITLAGLCDGARPSYIGARGLAHYDLALSYTGGAALEGLRTNLGARRAVALYGHVDPSTHRPADPEKAFAGDLSYLATYSADRQQGVERFVLEPARRRPELRFVIGGAQYPAEFPWEPNIFFVRHLPPQDHGAFFRSSRLTLNVTRSPMARMGWCPSGRLFEAAACGAPLVTDAWPGLEDFFEPGREILVARDADDILAALGRSPSDLAVMAARARERVLAQHTCERRRPSSSAFFPTRRRRPRWRRERMWGIIPAAGRGSRIQPLAFSKELLPVGSRVQGGAERPCAVSEYLVERMLLAGADKLAFVISPGKSDILEYYGAGQEFDGAGHGGAATVYVVQPSAEGLCDAVFRPAALISEDEHVLVGLPDTVWFPEEGFRALPDEGLSFLLFPVAHPRFFDAVALDERGRIREIQVKRADATSHWIWGAFKMTGGVFHALHDLWLRRGRRDEFIGTLVNAYLAEGGEAFGVRAGKAYVDVGTFDGYRSALAALSSRGEKE